MGRAMPVLLLWAVGLVQSLSACTRVQFAYLSETESRDDIDYED